VKPSSGFTPGLRGASTKVGVVAKQLKEFDVGNIGKWDLSLVWHIFSNNKCLPLNEWHEVSWTHSEEDVEKICVVF
jgi:hypothetical protein